jgi:hypothetical protein
MCLALNTVKILKTGLGGFGLGIAAGGLKL